MIRFVFRMFVLLLMISLAVQVLNGNIQVPYQKIVSFVQRGIEFVIGYLQNTFPK